MGFPPYVNPHKKTHKAKLVGFLFNVILFLLLEAYPA